MDKLYKTINRQCCLHCEMECDGKWLETEIEMYKEDLLKKQSDKIADLEAKLTEKVEFDKFKSAEELLKAYQNLEREFTKSRQRLAEMTEKYNACQEASKLESEFSQQDKKELIQQSIEKDQVIESLQEINQSLGQTCNNDAKEIERLREQLSEKEKEVEIEKKVSDWLYDIYNRTKFEEEVAQKCKTATEITKQCDLYECCKNQYINDLRSEVKKKLKY